MGKRKARKRKKRAQIKGEGKAVERENKINQREKNTG